MKYLRYARRVWHYPEVEPILELLSTGEKAAITRAIAAVIEDALNPPSEFRMLPLKSVYPPPGVRMPKDCFNRLVEDIRKCGVLHAITVEPCQNGRYRLIDGGARYIAAQQLNLPVIPATIVRES